MIYLLIFYSSTPPDGYCGDPPNYLYCNSCHTGAPLNPGNGSVYIKNLPSFYSPNTSYDLDIIVKGSGSKRFGFEMVIKDSLNNVIGTFQPLNSNTTVSPSGYIKHLNAPFANDSFIFQVRWNTPSDYTGKVYIYLVGNVANGNGFASGDSIYSKIDIIYGSSDIREKEDIVVYKKENMIFIEANKKTFFDIDFYNFYGRKLKIFTGYIEGKKSFKVKGSGILYIKSNNFKRVIKVSI